MATIQGNTKEKIFTIKKWYGLNENPDGDTKLKYGEAAYMRNWKITRDGNLKVRDGSDLKLGLCQSYVALPSSTESVAKVDTLDAPSTLVMYPNIAASEGKLTLSGTSVNVTPDAATTYADYYWKENKFRVWKLVRCDETAEGYQWVMKAVKAANTSLNPKVAGLWHGMVGGHEYVLGACDGKLWKLATDGTWSRSEIGAVSTTGAVHIFGFANKAYILDGSKYRVWDGTTYAEADGYIPVVLIATAPAGGGTELEQVNKLSASRRVRFSPDGTSTVFQLPEKDLDSIDSVTDYPGGTALTYTGDAANGTVTFGTAPAEGVNSIEVTYTVKTSFRDEVEKMRFSELYNGAQDTRVFLYGDGTNKVLYSGVDYDGNPRADYFPDLNVASIGTDNTPVTGLIRHFSRLMAYKTDSAYMITYGDITMEDERVIPGFYITPVNRAIGNTPVGQVRLVSNFPRTIHGQDCYEWKNMSSYSASLTADERQAQRISDRVYATLSEMDAAKCVCWDDDYSQEYYVCENKTAVVHNYASDAWYVYKDFDAVCFMSYEGKLYYGTSNGELLFLDPDERSNFGQDIDAYWESGSMDFGEDFRRKYSAQIWVGLKPVENSEVVVTVQTDKKSVYTEKVVQRKMASFTNMDFSDFSFMTNYKPFMQRLKIKAKKFTYYKIIFKTKSDSTGATIVAVDMRVRFNGYVK